MVKRLVDIDDVLLERARAALGTTTLKDTVNQALATSIGDRRASAETGMDVLARLSAEGVLHDRDAAW